MALCEEEHMIHAVVACAALLAASWQAHAQPAPPPDVRLTVRTRGERTTFRIGEVIPLELSFSSTAEKKYVLDAADYNETGRRNIDSFTVDPKLGWSDPLDLYFRSGAFSYGGEIPTPAILFQPVMVPIDLNEWVRFDRPGQYRVAVRSRRVSSVDHLLRGEFEAISNELRLTIVTASPEWQKETLRQSVAALDTPDSRRDTVKALRYLGTEAAAREMAHRIQNADCRMGMIGSPARAAGLDEMRKLARDPGVAVDTPFLRLMAALAIPDGPGVRGRDAEERFNGFLGELISAIPVKRGTALAVSLRTIVESPVPILPELRQSRTEILAANFDKLPVPDQAGFLEDRAKRLDPELLLPLVRKAAERYQDPPKPEENDPWSFNQAGGAALRHWYALAPAEARPAILREILRPEPRFQTDVLGILPDKELPDVEQALVAHLKATGDLAAGRNLALLIHRYASAAVEADVIAYLDQEFEDGSSDTLTPLLAWLLRVDPESARTRLENSTGYHSLVDIGKLQPSAILEGLAIRALDASDAYVVADAADYLTGYGSARTEEILWTHFADWSKRWTGREAGLLRAAVVAGDWSAGQHMMQALAAGHGWLTSEAKLRRLAELAVGAVLHQQAEEYLTRWQDRPWPILFLGNGQFLMAQYYTTSIEAAKSKLLQFPKGSEFHLSVTGQEGESEVFRELARFAEDHGWSLR
jgi:hypothetical protein